MKFSALSRSSRTMTDTSITVEAYHKHGHGGQAGGVHSHSAPSRSGESDSVTPLWFIEVVEESKEELKLRVSVPFTGLCRESEGAGVVGGPPRLMAANSFTSVMRVLASSTIAVSSSSTSEARVPPSRSKAKKLGQSSYNKAERSEYTMRAV